MNVKGLVMIDLDMKKNNKSFLISSEMEFPHFLETLKSLDIIDPTRLPQLVQQILSTLEAYETDYGKLSPALYKLCEQIMKSKDLKPEYVDSHQLLISQVIKIIIRHDFRAGMDSLKFVFNPGMVSQFYKTTNLDTNLNYPLGKGRLLEQYYPKVGEECDIVKPYITSTSFCGWSRCTVVQIQGNKYTVKYHNSDTPNTTRDRPWFAPLNSRMKDYNWRVNLDIGHPVDAYLNRVWYRSTIVEKGQDNGVLKVRVSFRRFDENGDRSDSHGNRFFGLKESEDEWIDVLSPRIQVDGKMADLPLCYYSATTSEILPEQFYDTIFQQEYQVKPFFGIMRLLYCKSLSLINFINTFVENGGIHKTLQIMKNPQSHEDIVYSMMGITATMVPFFPRMFIKQPMLYEFYDNIFRYFKQTTKTLNQYRIDAGYFAYDTIGRRLFTLQKVHQDQNLLRKTLIKQFLKMNMQKQMLSLRYLNELINPLRPYSKEQRDELHQFLRNQNIFGQIYNQNTHEQIISRSSTLLFYLIENQIVNLKQFQLLFNIASSSDSRARAVIEKLLSDMSKKLPNEFVHFLIDRILSLKQTDLTMQNLNLLKQLKNRQINNQHQGRILTFLWQILTVKSANVKTNIQEEVQKVFKAFVSTLNDSQTKMNLLGSMVQKIQDCKRVKNQIQLLKDFINLYPKFTVESQIMEQSSLSVPTTIYEAVNFVKQKGVYNGLLNLLFKSKDETAKKDILQFFNFLFEYDNNSDINLIIGTIYENLGPTVNFLQWVHSIMPRSNSFVFNFLQKTTDYTPFQNITANGFQAIQSMILDINKDAKNLKIYTTYSSKQSTQMMTGDASNKQGKKQFIGPLLPESKKTIHVLVSPFKLIGIKFLERLLQVLKITFVDNQCRKLIIRFISSLDQSIEAQTKQFRKEFLQDIIKQIIAVLQENKYDQNVKKKLQVYINLLQQIFGETEKDGIGNLEPHFQRVQKEKINLSIEFSQPKDKDKKQKGNENNNFSIVINQNQTLWALKKRIGQIVNQKPQFISIIKYVEPIDDSNNCKSLSDLSLYNTQKISAKRKQNKLIIRPNLLNEDQLTLNQKFQKIVLSSWFQQFKNPQNNAFGYRQLERLDKQKWRSYLFKNPGNVQKVFQEFNTNKDGFLTFQQLKNFFISKIKKNEHAVWILINMSGYKNDFSHHNSMTDDVPVVDTQALPRRILSVPDIYNLLYNIFRTETFSQLHVSFYKLLTMLEPDRNVQFHIKTQIYKIILEQQNPQLLSYSLEMLNAELFQNSVFFFEFWKNGGIQIIIKRITQYMSTVSSVYQLHVFVKSYVLPGFVKIINMYVTQLFSNYKIVKFVTENRINHIQLQDFAAKISKLSDQSNTEISTVALTLANSIQNPQQKIQQIYETISSLFLNQLRTYVHQKTDFLSRLTNESIRLLACIVSTSPSNHNFNALEFINDIQNSSLMNRRSVTVLLFIYFFYADKESSTTQVQNMLVQLLNLMPKENSTQNFNYFSFLKQVVTKYMEMNMETNQKDQFFIQIGNKLLDQMFTSLKGQNRSSQFADKVLMGILSVIESIIKKDNVCKALSNRKEQITQKCLFAYNIQQQLSQLQITQQMLINHKQSQNLQNYVMCKTQQNRNIAYNIVARMYELSADPNGQFISRYILPVVKSIKPDVRITSSKSSDVGLKNFGATCYMNSMLQVLNSVGPFRNYIMKCQSNAPVLKEMRNLFAALFYSQRIDYAPGNLLQAFVPPINPGLQQDTTQFLNFLFDQIEAGLAGTGSRRLLDQIFKGETTAQMICQTCGYKKQNKQKFFSFGVEIQNKFDLQSALEGTYQGQVITDYLCDKCSVRGQVKKRNILSEVPNILFIHLRRIVFNYDMFVNMKIHTRLQFPTELNIEPYTKEGVELREQLGLEYMKNLGHNDEETKNFEQLAQHHHEKDYYKLKLKGVIIHSGSADVGHYYSILAHDKIWKKFDDSRVGIFMNSGFENQCFGGSFTSEEWGSGSSVNAYVLVYEKVVKNPIKIYHMDENQTEVEQLVPYDNVKVCNNLEDYRQLWMDNHNFMVQTHLLDEKMGKGFINFVYRLIKNSSSSVNKFELIADIIYRISFHSGIVGDLQKILIENAEQATPDTLVNYVTKDVPRTFKLLLNNDRNIRDFIANFLHIVLMESYKKGNDVVKMDVLNFINDLLNAMTGEVAKNWLRVDGYFRLLFLLVSGSTFDQNLWQFFLSKNLISLMIDFVMQKQSPVRISAKNYSLGTKSNPMDFSSGINIISFMLAHSYGFTGKNYESPPIPEPFLFHLNNNDMTCLSCIQFYRKMLKERMNLYELSRIIHRLCILNLPFSKAIIEPVLQTICSITDTKDQMHDISQICLQIIRIKDDFWTNRAEMLLGMCFPSLNDTNLMTSIDNQKYCCTSTLMDIFPVECIVSYIYQYKTKHTLACFQLTRAIFHGCSLSETATKYLAEQPSPSYLFPNLTICLESFVDSILSQTLSLDKKQRQRLQNQVIDIKKYIQDVKYYIQIHYQGENMYKSAITGAFINKKQLNSSERDGICTKLYEYDVYCVESVIRNGINVTFDGVVEGGKLNRTVADSSNILWFFKKPEKALAIKGEPMVENQDKELIGLFDENPYPVQTNKPSEQMVTQNSTMKQQQMTIETPVQKSPITIFQSDANTNSNSMELQQQTKQLQPETIQQQINVPNVFRTNYYRQIQITNLSKQKKVVTLNFTKSNNCNFLVPNDISYKVHPTKIPQRFWMAKQDFKADWGEVSIKTSVQQFVKQKHQPKSVTNWWFKLYGEEKGHEQMQMQVEQQPKVKIQEIQNQNMQQINCPVCTVLNIPTNIKCQVCESDLH